MTNAIQKQIEAFLSGLHDLVPKVCALPPPLPFSLPASCTHIYPSPPPSLFLRT